MNTSLITRAAAALLLGSVAVLAQAADVNGSSRAQAQSDVKPMFKPGKPRVWDAVVSDAGVLQRGGAIGASAVNTSGAYQIDFPVDVTQCSFVASLGSVDIGTPASGQAVTARRVGAANSVFVQTTDDAGTRVPRAFHLVVVCA
ncbi:hypothetical protein KAK07_05360 [Ideonella sp. 4Y16]|uniref:hypothetical protein n=1 Tax=Ideonella alba TaxID=2824118 RepID=UPI001B375DBF|nr:hypothetical protein [Ideonella alba]MBQ0942752.1 hypothetical protein [Ideonella alba]